MLNTKRSFLFLNLLLLCLPLTLVSAETTTPGSNAVTQSPSQPFTKTPGGPKLGDLIINSPVTVLDEKGDWVQVKVEGWVRKSGLKFVAPVAAPVQAATQADKAASVPAAQVPAAQVPAPQVPPAQVPAAGPQSEPQADSNPVFELPALEIVSATKKKVSEGLSEPRIYLQVKIKNPTSVQVNHWSALLVASSSDGQVLFRESISDEKANLAPGGTKETGFYWTPDEPTYQILQAHEPSALKLELYKVTFGAN